MHEIVNPENLPTDAGFYSNPYFILAVVVAMIASGLMLKLVFNNATNEYKHDHSFE
jgi:hypothetical protein